MFETLITVFWTRLHGLVNCWGRTARALWLWFSRHDILHLVWHWRRPNRIPIWTGQGQSASCRLKTNMPSTRVTLIEARFEDRPYVVLQYLRTSNVQPCRSQTERRGIGIRGVLSPHRVVTLCVIPQSAPWFPFWFLTSHDWLKLQHTFPFWIRRVYSMYDDPGTENRTCCEAYT